MADALRRFIPPGVRENVIKPRRWLLLGFLGALLLAALLPLGGPPSGTAQAQSDTLPLVSLIPPNPTTWREQGGSLIYGIQVRHPFVAGKDIYPLEVNYHVFQTGDATLQTGDRSTLVQLFPDPPRAAGAFFVALNDDDVFHADKSVVVTLQPGKNYQLDMENILSALMVIVDDDAPDVDHEALRLRPIASVYAEGQTSTRSATYREGARPCARFTVRVRPALGGSVALPTNINYRVTQEGSFITEETSSIELRDPEHVSNGYISRELCVPIIDDDVSEADGKILVEILPATIYGRQYVPDRREEARKAYAIVRDDDLPTVSFGGTTLGVVEGSADAYTVVLNVDPPSYRDFTARLWIQEPHQGRWSATESSDYDYGSTVTTDYIDVPISAGTENVTVEVNRDTTGGVEIKDDADHEDYEHFYLKLTGGLDGYDVGERDWLRVTIIDDESPPPAPEANGDGTYTVPADWPLVPEELRRIGGEFRLLFLTNTWRDATTANIADYDAHVQDSIAGSHTGGSHPAIIPYSDAFKVVGSTPTVNARDHIDPGRDTAIYWLNGPRVARDTAGFFSSSWENWSEHDRRTAASVSVVDGDTRVDWHWSGTQPDGTKHALSSMGSSGHVVRGQSFEEGEARNPWVGASTTRVESHSILGISPVFRIDKRPRLEIVQADVEEPLQRGLLRWQGRQRMIVVDEPSACNTAPNDVSELGGVTHPTDLVTYRVRLYADPVGLAELYVYNPKYVVYRQGSLATGPVDSDHWNEIWKREIWASNFYRNGITVRPPGEDTTYAVSGGPPVNTYISLDFDSSNWDQWHTISVNVHCADHEDHNAYIIQHELELPGDKFAGRDRLGRGIDWNLSTWHDVRVKVVDTKSPQPADLTVDTAYTGTLLANAGDAVGYRCDSYTTGGECEYYFNIHWWWDLPTGPPLVSPGKPRNDLYDAEEHFSEWRVKVEADNSLTDTPPTYIYSRRVDRVIGHDGVVNQEPYRAGIVNTGLKTTYRDRSNPGDPVYRITMTPVTLRNDEVPGEAVTFCVQLQSPSGWPSNKFSVKVDCNQFTPPSTAPPEIRRAFSALGTLNDGSTMTLSSNALSAAEGGDVTFTVSASPVPPVDTPVIVSVTEEMGEGADRVAREQFLMLVIKAFESSASQTIIAYSDDDALSDGTLVAQIVVCEGYTLGDPSRVTLPLLDDDDAPTPVVSVSGAAGGTEGESVTFTVTASPAPAADLAVSVTVATTGDFGYGTLPASVTIPASGSATVTIATTDDEVDEADGSVTLTLNAGSGYTVGAPSSETADVSDDDDPVVEEQTGYTVDPDVVARVRELASQTQHGAAHVNRWNRVLLAFGEHDGAGVTGGPMTAAQAQDMADRHSSPVWDEVVVELTALEAASAQTPPPPTPEVSVTAGSGVTEGGDAVFTVTASPAPSSNLAVSVTVSQSGDYGATTGQRTVTVPTSGSVTLTVGTTDDSTDETDGSVTATVNAGSGYTVSSTQGAATVAVADDDDAPTPVVSVSAGSGITEGGDAVFTVTASPAPAANLDVSVTVSQSGDYGAATGQRTVTVPTTGSVTLTVGTTDDSTDETDGSVTATVNAGSGYTVSSTQGAATVAVADDDDAPTPVVSVSAGSGITEGGDAVFTVTASPAPSSNLDVSVTVSQSGDYGAATGQRTVTVPTTGSATLTVGTTDDNADETDGSVTATVNAGGGYTVSSTQGAATVSVADDDDAPTPVVSVSAGSGVTEGGDAVFTVTASPAPSANLGVSVTVSQSGDYGATTGQRTVTVPTTGSVTLTVGTTDDTTDETDGSVTVTVNAGSGYTVSSTQGAATVAVADNDAAPTPVVSVSAGSGVTEGGDAVFTVTASPAPSANLDVSVTVSQSGDYGATTGQRTVTVPTTGSATLTVGTTDDNADETDGSVTATVNAGSGYTVSSSQGAATVAVSDNDDAAPEVEISVTVEDASAVEGDVLEFRVVLSAASTEEIRVRWYTAPAYHLLDDRAHRSDYQTTEGELVFAPGVTELTGEVWLEQDEDEEPDEYFAVEAYLPGSLVSPDAVGTMTIVDDD